MDETEAERAAARKLNVRAKIESGESLTYDEVKREPWSMAEWNKWTPGTAPTALPPVAVAALADAIAQTGNSPRTMVADLRLELSEAVASGRADEEVAKGNEADLVQLEAELCGAAVPVDKCCKCRVEPREAKMVSCGHRTLCTACHKTAVAHCGGEDTPRAGKLARLMCPVCRGFELEAEATADSIFAIIDTNKSGTIESSELLLHLLVAGQEPETIAELFLGLDTDQDGVISKDEWRAGYARFLNLAHGGDKAQDKGSEVKTSTAQAVALQAGAEHGAEESSQQGEQDAGGEQASADAGGDAKGKEATNAPFGTSDATGAESASKEAPAPSSSDLNQSSSLELSAPAASPGSTSAAAELDNEIAELEEQLRQKKALRDAALGNAQRTEAVEGDADGAPATAMTPRSVVVSLDVGGGATTGLTSEGTLAGPAAPS